MPVHRFDPAIAGFRSGTVVGRQSPVRTWDIVADMTKTSVDVDRDIARQAAEILGTTTLRDTIDVSLREVVHAKRRLELVALLSEEGRFDFEAAEHAWGADK